MRLLVIIVSVLAALMTACGGEDDESRDAASSSLYPDCAEVWVVGETLPEGYEGCDDGDTVHLGVFVECVDGTSLFTFEEFDDYLFAIDSGAVTADTDGAERADPTYNDAIDACRG